MEISYQWKKILVNPSQALPRQWYVRDTFEVARDLLGKLLVTNINGKLTWWMIVEVEPYLWMYDKASHAYPNKLTPRTAIQFEKWWACYVFFVYWMYHQFCITTQSKWVPDVVLIRAVEPVVGIDVMQKRRWISNIKNLTNWPGKLTIALWITKELYWRGLDSKRIWIQDFAEIDDEGVAVSKRIGIDYAGEYAHKYWRFYLKNNKFVSKIDPNAVPFDKVQFSGW